MQAVNANDFQKEVLQATEPVLVDFWAPWCGPCKMIAPVVDKIATQYSGKLKVVKLNSDDSPSIAAQYDVTGIPCLILFKHGDAVDRMVGYTGERQIAAMVERHLAPAA